MPEGETEAYPFTQAEVESLGADYVALGHFHGLYPTWGDGDECEKACCYSGTHEPDQFGGAAGYALLATVNAICACCQPGVRPSTMTRAPGFSASNGA